MAKTESTAINHLIALVHSAPIRISEPLDHAQTRPVAPIPPLVRDSDPTLYVEKPILLDRPIGVPAPIGTPVPAPIPVAPPPAIPLTPRTRNALAAADVIREIRRQQTMRTAPRVHFDSRTLVKILAMMVAAVVVGALCGRLFARSGSSAPKLQATPPPAVAAAPATPGPTPAPAAPVVTVIETPKPAAQNVVTVDFMSQPAGASVTLVSNGVSIFVGTTPVMAQVDATIVHDVVFTLDGHATKLAHLTPSKSHHVSVVLEAVPAKEHVAARRTHRTGKAAAPTVTDDESKDVVVVSDE